MRTCVCHAQHFSNRFVSFGFWLNYENSSACHLSFRTLILNITTALQEKSECNVICECKSNVPELKRLEEI